MTPDAFRAIGQRLFGDRWQAELARFLIDFGLVGSRTDDAAARLVRYWAAGDRPVPAEIASVLTSIDEARHAAEIRKARRLQKDQT